MREDLASQEDSMNPKGGVRYLAHCGLAYHERGDSIKAVTLLRRAKGLYRRGDPHWLTDNIAGDMERVLETTR